MKLSHVQKFSAAVNTVILLMVFGLMAFFHLCKVHFLTMFSIPTAMIYFIGYYLIYKEKLLAYVWMVYCWLTFYMGVTTVCLGYGYGFHLYCFSMIPTIFVTEYISYKTNKKSVKALPVSIVVALFYVICTGYVAFFGPVYHPDQKFAAFFWIFNAVTVFGFLIFYSRYLITSIISSQEKLIEAAHVDRLTHLYNRHYMLERLEEVPADGRESFLAMSDIDNFKKINDTYGHNGGDEVLKTVADKIKNICSSCIVARWGGEEFLILSSEPLPDGKDMLERLRKNIESESISFEGQEIRVTLTIGMAVRKSGQSIDKWVQDADNKLYIGKNSGKNKVVI